MGRGAAAGRCGLDFRLAVVVWVATLPCSDCPPPTEPITISSATMATSASPTIQPRDSVGARQRARRSEPRFGEIGARSSSDGPSWRTRYSSTSSFESRPR